MKGVQGLVLAGAMGVVGAVCNWLYLAKQAEEMERVSFVAVRQDAQINVGERFKDEHFDEVRIPKNSLGNLEKVAVLWEDRVTIRGKSATRNFNGGELLLLQDLKEPTPQDLSEMLGENEVARWVPVDSSSFIPQKVNPGDMVSFVLPKIPDDGSALGDSRQIRNLAETEIIGPFHILMVGTRTGRPEVQRASGESPGPEHIITIRVRLDDSGGMEPKAEKLFKALHLTGNKSVQVMLHSAALKEG